MTSEKASSSPCHKEQDAELRKQVDEYDTLLLVECAAMSWLWHKWGYIVQGTPINALLHRS